MVPWNRDKLGRAALVIIAGRRTNGIEQAASVAASGPRRRKAQRLTKRTSGGQNSPTSMRAARIVSRSGPVWVSKPMKGEF